MAVDLSILPWVDRACWKKIIPLTLHPLVLHYISWIEKEKKNESQRGNFRKLIRLNVYATTSPRVLERIQVTLHSLSAKSYIPSVRVSRKARVPHSFIHCLSCSWTPPSAYSLFSDDIELLSGCPYRFLDTHVKAVASISKQKTVSHRGSLLDLILWWVGPISP